MDRRPGTAAGEVKDLAQETARATDDIARLVTAIQTDSAAAVEATRQTSDIIARINDYQTTIASAVEEQSATTAEMGRNVTAAADASGHIGTQTTAAASAAARTGTGVDQVNEAVTDLIDVTDGLRHSVTAFTL